MKGFSQPIPARALLVVGLFWVGKQKGVLELPGCIVAQCCALSTPGSVKPHNPNAPPGSKRLRTMLSSCSHGLCAEAHLFQVHTCIKVSLGSGRSQLENQSASATYKRACDLQHFHPSTDPAINYPTTPCPQRSFCTPPSHGTALIRLFLHFLPES